MPELRKDWLTGRSVIIAENRALRPNEFSAVTANASTTAAYAANCYFCAGHEAGTPPAVYEQTDEQGHWRVRVIPNKFPAVTLEVDNVGGSLKPAFGAHEVIVESSRHIDRTTSLSVRELANVLEAYAARLRHWREYGQLAYGLVFKNQGPRAGASIAHLHSQLIALPMVPPAVEAEAHRAEAAFSKRSTCPYCAVIDEERAQASRIVMDQDGFTAFCPYASVQPHEVWLMPANHWASFENSMDDDTRPRLAAVLHAVIARLEAVTPSTSYNMLIRTAPWRAGVEDWSHWRIELLPRTNPIAGFELATGIFINAVAPEHAAQQLRPV
jgi:UDPglucose--hexose-1-phosphate uridylyltransferase